MPKQETILIAVQNYLEELRTSLEDRSYTQDDFSTEKELINDIEILLMQLQ